MFLFVFVLLFQAHVLRATYCPGRFGGTPPERPYLSEREIAFNTSCPQGGRAADQPEGKAPAELVKSVDSGRRYSAGASPARAVDHATITSVTVPQVSSTE